MFPVDDLDVGLRHPGILLRLLRLWEEEHEEFSDGDFTHSLWLDAYGNRIEGFFRPKYPADGTLVEGKLYLLRNVTVVNARPFQRTCSSRTALVLNSGERRRHIREGFANKWFPRTGFEAVHIGSLPDHEGNDIQYVDVAGRVKTIVEGTNEYGVAAAEWLLIERTPTTREPPIWVKAPENDLPDAGAVTLIRLRDMEAEGPVILAFTAMKVTKDPDLSVGYGAVAASNIVLDPTDSSDIIVGEYNYLFAEYYHQFSATNMPIGLTENRTRWPETTLTHPPPTPVRISQLPPEGEINRSRHRMFPARLAVTILSLTGRADGTPAWVRPGINCRDESGEMHLRCTSLVLSLILECCPEQFNDMDGPTRQAWWSRPTGWDVTLVVDQDFDGLTVKAVYHRDYFTWW